MPMNNLLITQFKWHTGWKEHFLLINSEMLSDILIQMFPNSSVVRNLDKSFCFAFLPLIIFKKTIVSLFQDEEAQSSFAHLRSVPRLW